MSSQALQRAVSKARSRAAFAKVIGISRQRLAYVLSKGNLLPAEFVLATEEAFGVPRHELRPDIYPPSEVPAERTVGTGAPVVPCDRSAGLQRGARA